MGDCKRYDVAFWISCMKGNLDALTVSELESHCQSCVECRTERDFFQKLSGVVEIEGLDPPEDWAAEASARFDSNVVGSERALVAELVFDSLLHDAEAVRSRRLETRHLVFNVTGFQIDLILEYSGPRLDMLMGHVLPTGRRQNAYNPVELEIRYESGVLSTLSNELGEFIFKLGTRSGGDPLELRCTFQEGPCAIVLIPC